jgi:hypothetical protein
MQYYMRKLSSFHFTFTHDLIMRDLIMVCDEMMGDVSLQNLGLVQRLYDTLEDRS